MGECKGGIYGMEWMGEENRVMMVVSGVEVWHKRVGHVSKTKLCHFKFLENFVSWLNSTVCDVCKG